MHPVSVSLRTYFVPDPVLSTRDIAENTNNPEASSVMGEIDI